METKEIVEKLRVCAGFAGCLNCTFEERSPRKDCAALLKKMAVERLEQLSEQLSEHQPEWISVEDRLPGSEFVLCTDGEYCFVNIITDMEDVREDGVTHWMPLPVPPKPKLPTFKDVFLEKFPRASVDDGGNPCSCVEDIFPWLKSPVCNGCCKCWNQPYFEEEGEADA